MPYLGYVEVELKVPGDAVSVDGNCVFLFVPSTEYNKQVPLLIGTDILKLVLALSKNSHGTHFMQKAANQNAWWLAFRSMCFQDRQLRRYEGRVALIQSASRGRVVIPSNRRMIVSGLVIISQSTVMMHPTEETNLQQYSRNNAFIDRLSI